MPKQTTPSLARRPAGAATVGGGAVGAAAVRRTGAAAEIRAAPTADHDQGPEQAAGPARFVS